MLTLLSDRDLQVRTLVSEERGHGRWEGGEIADLTFTHSRACSKVISPVFEKLEAQYPNIGFYKCDVDEQEVRFLPN